jgi:hypothetical protein
MTKEETILQALLEHPKVVALCEEVGEDPMSIKTIEQARLSNVLLVSTLATFVRSVGTNNASTENGVFSSIKAHINAELS